MITEEALQTLELPDSRFHLILQGHVLDCLAKLPDDSIDTVMTSPPYWGLRDYKLPPTVWDADPKCEHEWQTVIRHRESGGPQVPQSITPNNIDLQDGQRDTKSDFCSKCSAWKGQLGLEPDFRLYVKHLLQITKELKRILKPTGCLWLNLGDTYSGSWGNYGNRPEESGIDNGQRERTTDYLERKGHPETTAYPVQVKTGVAPKSLCFIPQRVALAMIDEQGWILRNQVVWFKPNGMPSSVRDRFSNRWEPMFFFTKEPRYWFDLDAVREPHASATLERNRYPHGDKKRGGTEIAWGSDQKEGNTQTDNPAGKNPGDVIREPAVRHKSWASNPGHDEGHQRVYEEGKDGSDFWEITTEPHPFAHFAVYPDALVERPVKASCPLEVCVKCDKARERITESNNPSKAVRGEDDELSSRYPEGMGGNYQTMKSIHRNIGPNGEKGVYYNGKTLGWTSCSCNEPIKVPRLKVEIADPENFLGRPGYRPGIVLDPFAGSGTTAVVAKRLQRSSISVELAEHYIPIIKERLDFGHETIDGGITWMEMKV